MFGSIHWVASLFRTGYAGKIICVAGDTRQIPPVVVNGGESETCAASVLSSSYYRKHAKVRNLSKTMRNRHDPKFSAMVDDIGDGAIDTDVDGFVSIPGVAIRTDLETAVDFVYPADVLVDPVKCAKRAIITSHNDTVDDINNMVLEKMPGELQTVVGRTLLDHECLEGDMEDSFCMSDYLTTVHHSGVPAHTLSLKVGIVVLLTRNLDVVNRLCNGSKLVVEEIRPYTLRVLCIESGVVHYIPRITFSFKTWQSIAVKRVQFPVRLCFAVTIHRSQGLTLDKVVLDARRDVFSHGALYVGLSRVCKSSDVLILTSDEKVDDHGWARVRNVVYPRLLPGH